MSTRPPSAGRDAARGLALLLVVVVVLAVMFWDGDGGDASEAAPAPASPSATASSAPKTTAAAPSERRRLSMPHLAGVRLDVAEEQLWALEKSTGVDIAIPTSRDLSPRGRGQWQDENWTVAATRPAAGQAWTDGMEVYLFVLRNDEWAWFQAHPTMPALPVDVAADDLTQDGQLFAGMRELLEYRYAPGHEPQYASQPYSRTPPEPVTGLADDPSIEPAAEREERDALFQAFSGALTVGSLPPEGTALRVGRLLTLTVRDQPPEPVQPVPESDVYVNPNYSDGDDDVNVPGWLCPTRFC
jgi:hypothetical protein